LISLQGLRYFLRMLALNFFEQPIWPGRSCDLEHQPWCFFERPSWPEASPPSTAHPSSFFERPIWPEALPQSPESSSFPGVPVIIVQKTYNLFRAEVVKERCDCQYYCKYCYESQPIVRKISLAPFWMALVAYSSPQIAAMIIE
jgi:hypothetical protein